MRVQIISILYKTILDALFPLSAAEDAVLSLSPQEACAKLPRAPGYERLAVSLPNARSIFAYKDERVAKLVWNIKYKKSAHAVGIGGYALWDRLITTTGSRSGVLLDTPSTSTEVAAGSRSPSRPPKRPENPLPSPVIVIPMPITNRRRKERGYNQCELIVDEMRRLDMAGALRIEKNLLIRTHHAARQTLKDRNERVEGAKGIFAVNEGAISPELLHSRIVVIDDVITTGSTTYEALETMKKAGFEDVRALSLAH